MAYFGGYPGTPDYGPMPMARPQMPMSQGQGGMGGFLGSDAFGDWIGALGASLMSSPANAPLANFAPALQDARRLGIYRDEQRQKQQTATATKQWLLSQGLSEEEANAAALDPAIMNALLKQVQADRAYASDQAFSSTLANIGGGIGNPEGGSSATSSAKVPSGGSSKLDELMQRRRAYVDAAAKVRTPEQRQKAELYIGHIDEQIEREEEASRLTESQRDLGAINNQRLAAGLPPYRLDEWQQLKAKSGAANIDLKGETKYDETFNTELAKRAIGIEDQATAARKSLGTLKLMEKAISDPGFYSGTGAGAVTNLKRLASGLGLPGAEGIDSIESFTAMSRQAALDAMGGSLGSGFSNADRSFVEEQVANLANTPEGNTALIQIQRATANRQLEIARLARAYAEKNGGRIDTGFYDRLARWAEQNPLFTDENAVQGADRRQGRVSGGSGRANGSTGLSRPRATNPQTGETVEWDGTQWSPVR